MRSAPTILILTAFVALGCLIAGLVSAAPDFPLVSGALIPVGGPEGRGPLAADAVVSHPIGAVSVFGSEQPDLFVRTDRFGSGTGLFLYPWVATAENGAPVFGERIPIAYPVVEEYRGLNFPPRGAIFQAQDGRVLGFWMDEGALVESVFNKEARSFEETAQLSWPGLPNNPNSFGVLENSDGSLEILAGIGDGVAYRPPGVSGRDPLYRPYDGAGVWLGGFPYAGLFAVHVSGLPLAEAAPGRQVSATMREVRQTYEQLTPLNLGPDHARGLITGSHFGGLHYYPNSSPDSLALGPRVHAVAPSGTAHRHPSVGASPLAYPNPETGLSDLIVGGEGGLYYYRFTGRFTDQNKPVFELPVYALEQPANLYAGSLPVPNVVDWDGDGDQDIVSGNSEGLVLFFENEASDAAPSFLPGIPVEAGGRPIHIQPGYRDDIQGPGEARWGYTCPVVADWSGDGLLDILMSDSTAKHTVFLNRGTPTAPDLEAGHPLYLDGLDLHGTWRTKPAVAKIDGRTAYAMLDDDDQFHLYWRLDDHNLEEGQKLCLEDGRPIAANFLHAGGTGRLKLNLVDWDEDGLLDLIVGTPRHGSVPDPEQGLPQSLGLPGSAVLYLRNVGAASAPAFEFPKLLALNGAPVFLGQHACAPAMARFGGVTGLVVGEEDGRLRFYRKEEVSWLSAETVAATVKE